jgi:hypothetical protein
MKKRHLTVAVVAVLALSSSTIASAEGGSHRRISGFEHMSANAVIALTNHFGILSIDTSTAEPSFHFDTTTATPHIDFDSETATTHFDTSTATSGSEDEPGISSEGEDDSLPAGMTIPVLPTSPTPPAAPSWITKPHAKSNDDNPDHAVSSSEDSQD